MSLVIFDYEGRTTTVLIEKIYQTLKTVFDHISKHLKVCQKYSATCRIFNSLLGVWKCGQTQSFMFDILLLKLINYSSSLNKGSHDHDGVWISDLN